MKTVMSDTHSRFWPQGAARLAGGFYLIVIVAGIAAELVVRQRLVVRNDAAATASNVLANEQLFRWGFAADVVGLLCVVPLIVLLYELFKVVDRRLALTALCFSLVGSAVQATALLGHFAPIILLTRGAALGVDPALLRAQAYMALQLQGIGYAVALAFFGGTMLVRGYLIARSAIVPRVIGILLMVEGIVYLANSFVDFLAPGFASTVLGLLLVTGLAEVALALWLLVRGVNASRWQRYLVPAQ
jgi:hypothetical protein